MRILEAELLMKPFQVFEKEKGLQDNGPVQSYFTEQIYKYSEPYTPRLNGIFGANVDINPDNIYYKSPFASYLWNGKKFVDPLYQIGAFYSPTYGFWSRPGVLKEETDIDLNYNEAPMRGPFWINRMWAEKDQEIIKNTQLFKDRGV